MFRDNITYPEKLLMISWPFLGLITMVAFVGVMSLYSAAGGSIDPWAGKHAVRFMLGMAGLLVVALIDIRLWLRLAYPVFIVCVGLLVFVEIKGHIGMGAQRWINLGFMQLQPSEMMKIATILALAKLFHSATPEDVRNPFFLIFPLVIIAIPTLLVAAQPDLTTAITILLVSGAVFFLAGVSYWIFAAVAALVAAAVPLVWTFFMHDYQRQRVLTFLDPEADPLKSGYQLMQSKIAVGSGGLSGKGFMLGSQSHLNFLPEKETDFIFTLFTEEWGLIGGLSLLSLFALIITYGYVIAFRCHSQFARIICAGVVVNFSLYIFINIAMVMGLIPVAGVPLPMVSYGGSVMMSALFGFGLLMSAHVHRDVKFTRRGREMA